ncbi:MAG: hypothetical protein OHK0052_11120 [Anaerolineales bacterium]
MLTAEMLKSVQFVVGQDGKPTAAIVDISLWNAFLDVLDELDDVQLARVRLQDWQTKENWRPWALIEADE